MSISIEDFAARLQSARAEGALGILAGAGVSMLPPSDLPSGAMLKDLAVRSIAVAAGRRDVWRCLRRSGAYRDKVPEVLLQSIYDSVEESRFFPFFKFLRQAHSNGAHELLGAWHSAGVPLFTTNFDLLIDRFTPDREVVHLHGSLLDPATMVVRLHQVGRGLDTAVAESFVSSIGGKWLCLLGYSGNDLDISDAVREARPRGILWLMRGENDAAFRNLDSFGGTETPKVIAIGNLAELVGRLGGTAGAAPASPLAARRMWVRASRRWARTFGVGERTLALASILEAVQEHEWAADLAVRGFARTRDVTARQALRTVAVNALIALGRHEDAVDAATRESRTPDDPAKPPGYQAAVAYASMGDLELAGEMPNVGQALQFYALAIEALDNFLKLADNHPAAVAHVANFRAHIASATGLGLMLMNLTHAARRQFAASLEQRRAVGDLHGIAEVAINMSVSYSIDGHTAEARAWRREGLAIAEKYGFLHQKGYLLRWLGRLAFERGRRAAGRRILRGALALYDSIPDGAFGREIVTRMLDHYGRDDS